MSCSVCRLKDVLLLLVDGVLIISPSSALRPANALVLCQRRLEFLIQTNAIRRCPLVRFRGRFSTAVKRTAPCPPPPPSWWKEEELWPFGPHANRVEGSVTRQLLEKVPPGCGFSTDSTDCVPTTAQNRCVTPPPPPRLTDLMFYVRSVLRLYLLKQQQVNVRQKQTT